MTTVQWIALAVLALLSAVDVCAADTFFRCEKNGQTVLTDRINPGDNCRPLNVPQINTIDSSPARTAAPARRVSVERQSSNSIADEQIKAKQRCERIRLRLDEVVAKMRNGYTLEQGERLRERKKSLEAELKIERCR